MPLRHRRTLTLYHNSTNHPQYTITPLDVGVVCDRCNRLGLVVLGADGPLLSRLDGLPLEVHLLAALLGLALLGSVLLHSDQELLTGTGKTDVLDADVDALLDVAVADLLVEDDTNGGLGDVVDDTGLAVVDLEGLKWCSVSTTPCYSCTRQWVIPLTMPFWTAPFVTMSTMSPTLYWRR